METCACIICGCILLQPTKLGIENGLYQWVVCKGRSKRRLYFHTQCYKRMTKGGRDAS